MITTDTKPLDVAAIRARADEAKAAADMTRFSGQADLVAHGLKAAMSAADVPALLDALAAANAEIERLYELRRAAIAWRRSGDTADGHRRAEAALIEAVDKLIEGGAR